MNKPANQLQKAIQKQFESYHHFTIIDPKAFLQMVKDVVNLLNAEHPRCRPETVGSYYIDYDKELDHGHVVYVSGVFRFTIRRIEAVWSNTEGYRLMEQEGGEGL